ncbi:MAG: helix-turn-helix domain-containing protein [Prevotellaceae bacterium]|nr:helix-turn-helix domain-containing protein [Prevotellaceae bacterium]
MAIFNLKSEEVRRIRRNNNLSQEYMADKFNVSQSQYSKIENGKCVLDLQQVNFLADLLKTNVGNIIDFGEAKNQFIEYFNIESQQVIINLTKEISLLMSKIEDLTADKKIQMEQIKILQKLTRKK